MHCATCCRHRLADTNVQMCEQHTDCPNNNASASHFKSANALCARCSGASNNVLSPLEKHASMLRSFKTSCYVQLFVIHMQSVHCAVFVPQNRFNAQAASLKASQAPFIITCADEHDSKWTTASGDKLKKHNCATSKKLHRASRAHERSPSHPAVDLPAPEVLQILTQNRMRSLSHAHAHHDHRNPPHQPVTCADVPHLLSYLLSANIRDSIDCSS